MSSENKENNASDILKEYNDRLDQKEDAINQIADRLRERDEELARIHKICEKYKDTHEPAWSMVEDILKKEENEN